MALTFLGLERDLSGRGNEELQVDHIDGDKHNNQLSNLEIVTKRENLRRAWNRGAYARNGYASKGRAKPTIRRFTSDQIDEMTAMRNHGKSYRVIAAHFQCDHKAIYRILRGETYQQR